MSIKHIKWQLNIPDANKINQNVAFEGPQIYTRIRIFGLKIYHLATLV
jgi:hypothetical protein